VDRGSATELKLGKAPLVGRAAELHRLGEVLQRSRDETLLVCLSGEPGVGKTRLLAELACQANGWLVLRGGAHEAQGQPANVMFVEALRDLLDQAGSRRQRTLRQLGELRRLLPEAAPVEAAGAGAPQDRARLMELLAGLLRRLSRRRPILLLLDDLQWADRGSLELLGYVRRRLQQAPLLIAATYRDSEVDATHPLSALLDSLRRGRLVEELRLGRLDALASGQLAAELLGGPVAPELMDWLQRRAEGNPYFIEELLRGLGEAGALEREQRGWHLAEGAEALFRLSPELRTSLWLRLQPLSAACRGLLETAAVLGRRFDPQIAASTHGLSEQQALPLLDEALGQAVLQSRNRQLEFSHDLLRAALDEAINPLRRRQLHDRAAEALRQHGAGQRAPAALAFHLLRSSRPEQAVPVLLKAGERALSTFAFDNAVEHLQTAADLLREGAEDSQTGDVAGGVGLPGVLVRLGEALMGAGRYDAALEVYDEALRSAAGDRELIGRLYARIGDIHLAREETERAIAAHRSSLACFGQADHPDAARALLQLAELRLVALSEHAEGASLARRALRMARGLGSAELEAEALGAIGTAEVRMGRPAGVGTLGQALSAAERLGSPTLIGRIANRLAQHHYWAAELSESGAAAQRAVAGLRGVADPRLLGWPTFWLGLVAFTRGEWESARRRAAELLQLGEQLGVRRFQAQGLQIQGMVAQDLGQLDEAVVLLGQAADLFRAIAPGTLVFYLGRSCLALLQAGRQAAGERVLAELETLVESLPPTAKPRLSGQNLVGLAYLALGRADADQRIERGLRPARDQLHWSLAARRS
jgi:tetratricopeptide (TPR) repeat protein